MKIRVRDLGYTWRVRFRGGRDLFFFGSGKGEGSLDIGDFFDFMMSRRGMLCRRVVSEYVVGF